MGAMYFRAVRNSPPEKELLDRSEGSKRANSMNIIKKKRFLEELRP